MGGKGRFPISASYARLETLSNDIDVLAYLIQKLPIISYIGQSVDHLNAVIDALAASICKLFSRLSREWYLSAR